MKNTKLAVTLTTSALLAAQTVAQTQQGGQTAAHPAASAADVAAASKADLKAQLATKDQGAAGASEDEAELYTMCYMAPFEVTVQQMEYVCPICGERTTHVSPGYIDLRKGKAVSPDIDECRRLFARIPASAGLKLDESEYCRKCSPRVQSPAPVLLVPTAHGRVRRVSQVTGDELRQLGDYFAAPPTVQEKMRKESRRLRKLLGQ